MLLGFLASKENQFKCFGLTFSVNSNVEEKGQNWSLVFCGGTCAIGFHFKLTLLCVDLYSYRRAIELPRKKNPEVVQHMPPKAVEEQLR